MDIRLLGQIEVSDSTGSPVSVPGERQRGLLAILSMSYPRAVTVDRIVDSLWPDSPGDRDENLRVVVSRLRKAIGNELVKTVESGYRLDAPSGTVDVDRFRHHGRRGRQLLTLGHPAKAAEAFRQALAQWRGPALADIRSLDFAEETARSLEEERVDMGEWLMEAALQAGDHRLVVGELAGLATAHPTRERLWYLLMLALYRSGRQAEALRAYTRLRTVLGEELGIEPSPEMADLEERILLHDPSLIEEGSNENDGPTSGDGAQLVTFKPGDLIVEEGEHAAAVYWIEEGEVEVFRRDADGEHALARLGKGQYFGELASLLGTGRTASVRAISTATMSVHSVTTFRQRLGVERARVPHELDSPEQAQELLKRGDYLRAYDTASTLIEQGQATPQLRYLAVLALARAGATSLARRKYSTYGLDTVDPSTISRDLAESIAALIPRLDKDMALRSSGETRAGWARRSALGYEDAFQRTSSPYPGANAATMWLMAGDDDHAAEVARSALDLLDGTDTYWEAVTAAECALVLGNLDDAGESLERAGRAGDSNPAARASTLRNLRAVCQLTSVDLGILDPIKNPTVVHYSGHRIVTEGANGRFPPSEEPRVASELASALAEIDAGIGFGSLAAGADILAAEALLERGAELHVVLPFERDEFVRASVAPAGEAWVERFERCLALATSVTTAINSEYLDDPVLFDFCARIAMGDALVRADVLQTDPIQVVVWDGTSRGGAAGTEVDMSRWRATGNRSVVIGVGDSTPRATADPEPAKRQVRGLVFADFAGFSALSDAQVVRFQDEVIGSLSKVVAEYDDNLLSGRTWGDAMYLVFDDICAAAECTLDLQAAVEDIDLDGLDLRELRGMRVAAHAAPVFEGWDPIGKTSVFFGSGVTKTARIEPRTPEGEVYVTHAFAALAVLAGQETFECTYVGTVETAKSYGPVPLYSLRSRRQTSE